MTIDYMSWAFNYYHVEAVRENNPLAYDRIDLLMSQIPEDEFGPCIQMMKCPDRIMFGDQVWSETAENWIMAIGGPDPGHLYRRRVVPIEEGYYWAKWKIAAKDTPADVPLDSDEWRIVEVNINCYNENNPEHLSVNVFDTEVTQRIDCFHWATPIQPLRRPS
jgi:hypothetical protein